MSKHMPGVMISYHDPNFGVKFDQVMDIIESIPEEARNPYIIESTLSVLKGSTMERLGDTNCAYAAPGVESWADYSSKAGVGSTTGKEKLEKVVAHLQMLFRYVKGLQVNFMFGTDADKGKEPVELTKAFIRQVPFVWPTTNIPTPFGGTPLFQSYLQDGRILSSMPFSFYYTPYLVTTLKNYDPLDYYEKLIEIYEVATSGKMLMQRVLSTPKLGLKTLHTLRTLVFRGQLSELRRIRDCLRTDREFRDFHEGNTNKLPEFYRRCYKQGLGPYAELITEAEMSPVLEPVSSPKSLRIESI